jgi:nucleotide-binding universal stress UspA family protein
VRLDSTGRINWYVNSRAMLEPLFRGREAGAATVPRQNDLRTFPAHPSRIRGELIEQFSHYSGTKDEGEQSGEANILIPVDFSTGSFEPAQVGVSVAQYIHASILLCHAVFPRVLPFGPDSPAWVIEALQSEAMHKMAQFLEVAEQAGVKAKCVVEVGTPVGVILKMANRYAANLIVLASREHSPLARLLFGRTIAEQVTREADCHVMLVRGDQRAWLKSVIAGGQVTMK